jgi:hypothetical protein
VDFAFPSRACSYAPTGLVRFPLPYPRLAAWAAFCRRSAACCILSRRSAAWYTPSRLAAWGLAQAFDFDGITDWVAPPFPRFVREGGPSGDVATAPTPFSLLRSPLRFNFYHSLGTMWLSAGGLDSITGQLGVHSLDSSPWKGPPSRKKRGKGGATRFSESSTGWASPLFDGVRRETCRLDEKKPLPWQGLVQASRRLEGDLGGELHATRTASTEERVADADIAGRLERIVTSLPARGSVR